MPDTDNALLHLISIGSRRFQKKEPFVSEHEGAITRLNQKINKK